MREPRPWRTEPDHVEGEAHGLPYVIHRNTHFGNLCGYVGVPEGHPAHDKHYDEVEADVHGGLTYGADHAPGCKPDGRKWLGFDCAHLGDYVPFLAASGAAFGEPPESYRTVEYVRAECEKLACQMAAARPPQGTEETK